MRRAVKPKLALLALAAISLAAVALVRSVHGGSLVIGNIGFKQDTTRAADRAIESIQEAIHILARPPAGEAQPAVEKAEKE